MSEDLLKEQNPHSIEAEQAVLGSMLIDEQCIPGVIEILDSTDFYSETNRDIFSAIHSMFNSSEEINPVIVQDKMRADGVWNENTANYIKDLLMMTPTSANVIEYAHIVKDKSLLRNQS